MNLTNPTTVLQPAIELLRPHAERGARYFSIRMLIVLALTGGVLLLPTPSGLSAEGQRAIAAFVFTGSMFALEPVSLPIAALMVPVALVALGVANTNQALSPFAGATVFLVLASLFLAEALRKHGLTRRLALLTVVLSGGGTKKLLLGLMLVAAFFSMWVENTATSAVLIPVALTISRRVQDTKLASRLLVLLILGIAHSASVGGMATMMGSSANAVASQFLSDLGPWTFIDWFKFGFPAMLIILPLTWGLMLLLVPVKLKGLDVEPVRQELEKQGPMTTPEKQVSVVFALTILLWVSGSSIADFLGWSGAFFSATIIALLAVGVLSVMKILSWDDIKGVSWGIFFIIGAGLSLGETLVRTGATEWFAQIITPFISGPPLFIVLIFAVYVSAILTNLLNNTTIASVLVPVILAAAAMDPSLNPILLVMATTLATTFGYSLPSSSGRMALVASTGVVPRGEMMRTGLLLTLVSAAVLAVYFYVLSLLGVK